jgi:hypothetical protein
VRPVFEPRCFGVRGDHDQRLGAGPEHEVVDAVFCNAMAPTCRRQMHDSRASLSLIAKR